MASHNIIKMTPGPTTYAVVQKKAWTFLMFISPALEMVTLEMTHIGGFHMVMNGRWCTLIDLHRTANISRSLQVCDQQTDKRTVEDVGGPLPHFDKSGHWVSALLMCWGILGSYQWSLEFFHQRFSQDDVQNQWCPPASLTTAAWF